MATNYLNKNTKFQRVPTLQRKRSKFDTSFTNLCTANTGDLIPILYQEVLPGDTFKIETSGTIREMTPITPVMDNAYIDIAAFYVKNRNLWDKWEEFMGAKKDGHWAQTDTFEIPKLIPKETVITTEPYLSHYTLTPPKSNNRMNICNYLGLPNGENPLYIKHSTIPIDFDEVKKALSISALIPRAYTDIVNNWFLNENLQDYQTLHKDSTDRTVSFDKWETNPNQMEIGALFNVCKLPDYFTKALPNTQKGADPLVKIDLTGNMYIPVNTNTGINPHTSYPIQLDKTTPGLLVTPAHAGIQGLMASGNIEGVQYQGTTVNQSKWYAELDSTTLEDSTLKGNFSITDLRYAAALKQFLETDARHGTRYQEIMQGHFGITVDESQLDIPEYLGGGRFVINQNQVIQTSSTNNTSPQGGTTAYSLTNIHRHPTVLKSFEQHGQLLILAYIRTEQSYYQGIPRTLQKFKKFDFAFPELANIGEQPIYDKEIYTNFDGTNLPNTQTIFGYQERYIEYKTNFNQVNGQFQQENDTTVGLSNWHYGNYFTEKPVLNSDFAKETPINVQRTIALQGTDIPQWLQNWYFDIQVTRELPSYCTPGLTRI